MTYYRQIDINRFRYIATLFPIGISTILDIGARDNQFKGIMEMDGYSVTSLDIDPQETLMVKGTITSLPFKDNTFDITTAFETLEHLSKKELALATTEMSRVSRKYMLVSVPYNEVPLGKGHRQYFNETKFKRLFSNNTYIDYFGTRPAYQGIRKQLCLIDKRLVYLFNKIFGIKKSIVSNWIIGVFIK